MDTVIFTNCLEHLSHVCSSIFIELDIHLIYQISSVVKQEFVLQKLVQIYVCKSVLCNSTIKWARSGNILPFLLPLFQEGQLSVTGESICTKYWLAA